MNPLRPWQTTLAGIPAGFHLPIMLLAAALLMIATAWLVRKALHREMARGWVAPRLMSELVPGRAPRWEAAKVAALGLGLALLAIACSGPYWGEVKHSAERRGVDVVVALDASRSMLAQDVEPNRLTQARVAVESLIEQLHGDRIGLVTFAKDAFAQAPLTTDYAAARLYLRAVDPLQMQQGGTDVGGALQESRALLDRARKGDRQQVVVLLTDGEDWGQGAREQAQALDRAGIHLDTVAVGSEAGGPVPELDQRGRITGVLHDTAGAPVITHANRAALAALAVEAHGQAFDLASDLGVKALAHSIDTLQKSDIEAVTITAAAERFSWFALPGLALMVLGLWLSPGGRRRLAPALAGLALLLTLPRSARADRLHVPEAEAKAGADAYAAGKFDQALHHFEARTSHPEQARFNRGDALAGLGKTDEALEAFQTDAAELRGRDAYNRGTIQGESEHLETAVASLRRALIADSTNEDARHNLEVLLAKKDQQKRNEQKEKKDSGGSGSKDQQGKSGGESKDQKDQKDQAKSGGEPKGQKDQAKSGGEPKDPQPGKSGRDLQGQGDPTEPNEGESQASTSPAPREPSRAKRMLDSLKAGDRLLPYRNVSHLERSVPDAHPW